MLYCACGCFTRYTCSARSLFSHNVVHLVFRNNIKWDSKSTPYWQTPPLLCVRKGFLLAWSLLDQKGPSLLQVKGKKNEKALLGWRRTYKIIICKCMELAKWFGSALHEYILISPVRSSELPASLENAPLYWRLEWFFSYYRLIFLSCFNI